MKMAAGPAVKIAIKVKWTTDKNMPVRSKPSVNSAGFPATVLAKPNRKRTADAVRHDQNHPLIANDKAVPDTFDPSF